MDPELWRRMERVLDDVLELPPGERLAAARRAAEGDEVLAGELERFLAADLRAEGFLETPVEVRAGLLLAGLGDQAPANEEPADATFVGRRVGPYRLVRELGRGGMGVVFLAERADGQFEQTVALKLIATGRLSPAALRRFLAERQILARLQHPGIARLLDGGVSEDGLPFFALELVAGGVPITTYCAGRQLGVDDRLRLFEQVCQAVRFAHKNLIVHRDLKPSNVLVTPEGEVKLLDFGIAKLLDEPAERDATLTAFGPRPMTPRYAAPEVILGRPITTAADVYSLGVLLFELLTGGSPLTPRDGSLVELHRVVLEQEPERPSRAALATPGLAPAERDQLSRRLRGDLDAIVLQALQKEPEARYSSVEALLEDLRRHRRGLPIAARPSSFFDQSLRFVRRHKLAVGAGGLIALSLAAGIAGTLWQARVAIAEARRTEEVKEFLLALFEVADPDNSRGETVTARELLSRGAARLDSELVAEPALRAELLQTVGDVHRRLGDFESAGKQLERALELARAELGPGHVRVAEALLALADVEHSAGALDEAERRYHEAIPLLKAARGQDHRLTLRAESYLAQLLFDRGLLDAAEALHRQTLVRQQEALGADDPETLRTLHTLARILLERGDLAGAEPLFETVIEKRKRRFGELHSSVSEALVNLATLRDRQGDAAGAEALYRRALAIDRRLLPGHPELAADLNNLAALLLRQNRLDEALALADEALAIAEAVYGVGEPPTAPFLHTLAKALRLAGELARAEPLARRALALAERALGPDHENVAIARVSLAHLEAGLGQNEHAEASFRAALEVLERAFPAHDQRRVEATLGLASLLCATGRQTEGAAILRSALTTLSARPGSELLETQTETVLAQCAS